MALVPWRSGESQILRWGTHTHTHTHTPVLYKNHPRYSLRNLSPSGALSLYWLIIPQPWTGTVSTWTWYHLQLTGKDLEDSSDVKPAPFGEGEELAEEQEQGQNTEDDGQDHGGLDRLQPFWEGRDTRLGQASQGRGRGCARRNMAPGTPWPLETTVLPGGRSPLLWAERRPFTFLIST